MPITIKNDKGLYANCSGNYFSAENFVKVKEAWSSMPECSAWCVEFEAAMTLNKPGCGNYKYPHSHSYICENIPGGMGNETQLWEKTPTELTSWWAKLGALRSGFEAWSKRSDSQGEGAAKALSELDKFLPKKATLAKWSSMEMTELEPGWEAKGGHAWAIWMGSAREQGYMDDKKRPAGASAARLFESEAAALRTAKAAKFGGERGPAAIVRVGVECQEIVKSEPGANCAAPKMQMALREARELDAVLEEASLEEIRRVLGESPEIEAAESSMPKEGSLAGREDGYACWVDVPSSNGNAGRCGFLNIRNELGPLLGAALRATPEGAQSKSGYWNSNTAIVKVSCAPISVDAKLGEPEIGSLQTAIAWEAAESAKAALQKQDAQALKDRASKLESGAAQPRRKSRSL